MARQLAPALQALLSGIIDYAGAFPPASLSCREAFRNYEEYCRGEHAWLLRRFVVTATDVDLLLPEARGAFAVVAHADHRRAASLESKELIRTVKPFYWESDASLAAQSGVHLKIRAGGLTPEAIPSTRSLADVLRRCAELRLAFKATAGLHHPLRSHRALTYQENSPHAPMHGFVNVFLAAAFAWFGMSDVEPVLAEADAGAFRFDDAAHWRERSLTIRQLSAARREFAHSFGSCSFLEPVDGLKSLGWL